MRFYTHTSRSGQTMHRLMRALIRRVAAMGPTRQNVHLVVEQGRLSQVPGSPILGCCGEVDKLIYREGRTLCLLLTL